jgi:DNA-binding SARP family transcriptional activator
MVLVTEMAELRIELLGGFHVVSGGRAIPEEVWQRRKTAALFKLLALAPRHRLHREQVMDALWPDLAPAAAAANLRKAVYYARQAVPGEDGARLIGSVGELLCLPSEGLWIDVDAFRGAAARARQTGDPASYWEAVGLYRDGLLPDDRYEEWVIGRRDELRFEFLAIVEELAAPLEAHGDLAGATKAVLVLIADEPLEEAAHVRLMRLYALAGRRGEALRQYERLREMLAAELGGEPGSEAQRLYEEVRARQVAEPELSAELWERVGELRIGSGDTTGALNAFELALDAADSPAVVARLHRRSAAALLMQHDAERADEHLRVAELMTEDPAELARLMCLRANQAWERRDFDRAQELALRARELASVDGEADDLAAAEEALAIVSHFRGDWRRGLEVEIGRSAGGGADGAALGRVFDIHHCIGQYHLYGDGLGDDVEPYARRVLALAEQLEAVRAQAFAWCLLGESLLLHARWDEAAGCLERSCDLHESLGTTSGALPWQRLAELAVCRGAPSEADAPLRRAAAIATVSPMAMHMWGRIHATAAFARIEQGDPEAAAGSVRAAAAAAARYGDCPSCSALLNPIAAETFTTLGERERAWAHAEAAKRVASFFDSSAWQAMSESASASVAVVGGERTVAWERFTAAAELYERAGHPYWAERSRAQAAAA